MKPIYLIAFLILVLNAFSVFSAEVRLRWDLPDKNMDCSPVTDLAGCKVYWGTKPSVNISTNIVIVSCFTNITYIGERFYTDVLDLPGAYVTNCVITGLQANVAYYFAGTCYNNVGNESDFSEEVMQVASQKVRPSVPLNIRKTNL